MGNLKYGSYDEQTALEEKEAAGEGGAEFMKLKVGRNIVRILPPKPGQRTPFRVVFQHFIDKPGGKLTLVCARFESKKPCAVCQKIDELRQSKLKVDQDAANDMFARRRVFCNIIDRADPEKGVKVLAFGKQVHEQLAALRTDDVAGADYVDPYKGFDVVIERTGTSKNDTKYKVFLARKPEKLGPSDEIMQQWIDSQHDLSKYAHLKAPEEVRALLSGEEAEQEEQESSSGRKPRRQAEDDAIDTDGEEIS